MKLNPLSRALIFALGVVLASPLSVAQGLPDLGESAQADLSPAMERRIGESIMLEIRRNPAYREDYHNTQHGIVFGTLSYQDGMRALARRWGLSFPARTG